MKLSVHNIKGEDTGKKVSLSKEVFGAEPNDHAIYLDVKQYLANQRQGTHKSKEKSEIRASTRKIKKQKGTGTARAGSLKSHVFVGGGRAFGPKPRDYYFKLNKKLKVVARKSAFSYKQADKNITVIEDFSFKTPKTKEYLSILSALSLSDKKSLLILPENNNEVYLSSKNIGKANVTTVNELSTYDILNADTVIISEKSVEKINEILN
ncbi:MAG: 50S ribosomal protein L4 [Cyclobacteriaceae bacterium]